MNTLLGGRRRWLLAAVALAAVAIAGAAIGLGSGGEDEAPVSREPLTPAPPAEPGSREGGEPGPAGEAGADDPHAYGPPPLDEDDLDPPEREAARTVRAYVEGLDARDGAAVCALLAPGALEGVELPRRRGGCARSLRASIGYRDPRGSPVWDSARVRGLLRVELEGDRASVTATTVTRFADREQPSIEDDVIHLVRDGDRWLVAKASSTLYRATGVDDIPPQVLAPPE